MNDDILTEVACPRCSQPIEVKEEYGDGRFLTCGSCGYRFRLEGQLCAACYASYKIEKDVCPECGAPMTRVCTECRAVNWSGNETCRQCGVSLDIFHFLRQHGQQATSERLNEQMHEAAYFKEEEKVDSDKRMAELNAMEQERLRKLALRRQKQKEQEQRMIITTAVVIAVFVILVLIFALL